MSESDTSPFATSVHFFSHILFIFLLTAGDRMNCGCRKLSNLTVPSITVWSYSATFTAKLLYSAPVHHAFTAQSELTKIKNDFALVVKSKRGRKVSVVSCSLVSIGSCQHPPAALVTLVGDPAISRNYVFERKLNGMVKSPEGRLQIIAVVYCVSGQCRQQM